MLVLCWSTSLSGVALLSGNDAGRWETEGLEWESEFGFPRLNMAHFLLRVETG
jgi:hypothetical protein